MLYKWNVEERAPSQVEDINISCNEAECYQRLRHMRGGIIAPVFLLPLKSKSE